MNQANSTKLIPYGMTDFPAIIRNNYYYVDKTEYIRQIEQTARFFFFVRPRRFGKSLFLNMLECYYDCKTEKQFDELFGNLYVGKHPTPDRNKYLVLKMSFSSIVSDPEKMEASFNSNCDMIFTDFCLKYADLLPPDTLEMVQQKEVASEKLTAVCLSLRRQGLKMYLILDEYDNFANDGRSHKWLQYRQQSKHQPGIQQHDRIHRSRSTGIAGILPAARKNHSSRR